jgi:hypothetical protein
VAARSTLKTLAKRQTKQLVVCIDNEGYAASLEKRKIYVALRDAAAEKQRPASDRRRVWWRLSLSEKVVSFDHPAAGLETSGACR